MLPRPRLFPFLTSFALVALLAVVIVAQEPKPGFADPVLGSWDLTVEGPDGPYPSWVEITLRKETQLMGRFVGRSGSNRHLTTITYRDGDLTFGLPVQYEKNKSDLEFKGRLGGDRLEGTTTDADGRTLKWRGVRAPLLRREKAPAWGAPVTLFNGKDLSGWSPRTTEHPGCWKAVDGVLSAKPPCVDLRTDRTFGDFRLTTEFRYPAGSNSGIYLRGRYEVQIQDDAGKATDSLRMGGVYGFLRPYSNASGKPGEWQKYEITLVGRRVTVVLNGTTVVDNQVIPGITGGALDSDEGAPGPILFQGDHGAVEFRNVVLTPGS